SRADDHRRGGRWPGPPGWGDHAHGRDRTGSLGRCGDRRAAGARRGQRRYRTPPDHRDPGCRPGIDGSHDRPSSRTGTGDAPESTGSSGRRKNGAETMSDTDRSMMASRGRNSPGRLPAYDFTDAEEGSDAEFPTSLVSLGFITAALRRKARLWCATAVVGLLIGLGAYMALPATYQATTSVLLTAPPNQNPPDAILTDAALAQTRTVAGLALHKLGLGISVSSFLGSYTVTAITDRVLLFTVNAPSSGEAVSRARALATEFLQFRAAQLEAAQSLTLASLNQQVNQAKRHVSALAAQITQLAAQPTSAANQAKLKSLRAERTKATTALGALEQNTVDNQVTSQAATTATIKGSWVLDGATPILK